MAADRASPPDYFEALGVPRRFRQDPAALQQRFYQLSREQHPDRFTTAGARAQMESLERMSLLNQAYQTLKDPQKLREYFIELAGARLEGSDKAQIPMELAESWFELQESAMEDPDALPAKLAEFEAELKGRREDADRELLAQESVIDQALESGAEARMLFEKLARTVQSQSYLKSMQRDFERFRQKFL